MPTVDRLGHVAIRVDDVERAVTFYKGLGMRLVWQADDWCYLEAGDTRDGLALLGPGYKAAGPISPFIFAIGLTWMPFIIDSRRKESMWVPCTTIATALPPFI